VESSSSTTSHVAVKSSTLGSPDSSDPGFPVTQSGSIQSAAGSQPRSSSSASETVVLQTSNELTNRSVTDVELVHTRTGHGSKQLIRMSADNVVTELASRSGWFWSKNSPEHGNRTKVAPGTSTGAATNVSSSMKPVPKSSGKHNKPSRTNEKHEITATDGHTGLTTSSASRKGDDAGNIGSSDVETSTSASMQDHSQVSRHSLNESPVTSTPVRGNSNHEKQTESHPARQISSSSDASRPPSDATPSSPLGYAFILPETPIRSTTTTTTHTSRFSSVQSETVSAMHDASRQSSSINTDFDDARYEMLLREKAGLEGRLEVLERENNEMLQQQAELKQRAAMAEQQIKTFLATSQALNADRSAMAVDLETLRQNRARLEAVIVDAHKLLEEKEGEVRTLERDLELARLAGEKHLEKVADVRREVTSRDATVHDLKAKITELYVQSQTSDQSRQILEGELAAIRADVAALTEAKEWYANQLRATQKDRTRLQQEAATARAETITANVASERLRAENARVKRNLTEVEQRVLTEKQTLARHLEEIEADMLAREAALTVQLRQAELSNHMTSLPSLQDETEELSYLKAELQRTSERVETVQRENVELSRRLALSQQCVIDRDETVKSLERDRESAELRAEAAEENITIQVTDIQRLESERSELQLQLESAGKERQAIDESLHTLRRDTAVLETGFRRMQQDLAAKTAEVEKLSSLKTHRSEVQLSEVWPDTEAAAGLKGRTSATDSLALSQTAYVDKEIQSDDRIESVDGSVAQLQGALSVCMVTTDTQTEDSAAPVVTETAEKLLRVEDVVLQSEIISSATDISGTVTADVGSRMIEHSEMQRSGDQAHLELALTEKSDVIDRLNAELLNVRECLAKVQLELEAANRHRHALESEKLTELNKGDDGVGSLVLNTREDSVRIMSILDSAGSAGEVARVHSVEKRNANETREVELQTDEITSQTDELRQQLDAVRMQRTALQQELDVAVDEKLQLETAKVTVEREANATALRLAEVESLLQRTQDDLVRLEQQLSDADRKSLELHNSTVRQLESEKLTLQSQLDELTQTHHKDVSRLKSKVCFSLRAFDCDISNVSK